MYRIVPTLDEVMRIINGTKPKCRVSDELCEKESTPSLCAVLSDSSAYLVGSKTIVQLDHSDIITARARLSENLVCQTSRHPITNGIYRAASRERVSVVCSEPRRDELDGLVLKLVGMHERLICDYTARSSVLCR